MLAIVGLDTLVGGAHSLLKPIRVDREKSGFTLPEGIGGESSPLGNPQPPAAGPETSGDQPAGDDAEAVESSQATQEDGPATDASASDGKISLEIAAQLHERAMMGEPVWFLDARLRDDYDAGHIAGALFMAHTHVSSGEGLDELMSYSPPETGDLLVIYCTGGDCQASEDTAILLEAAGYTNIAIISAGFDEWAAAGLPTEGP